MKSNGKSLILLSFLGYKLFLFRIISCWFLKSFSLKAVSGRSRLVKKSNGKSLILLSILGYKLFLFRIIYCWFLKSFLIKSCLRKIKVSLVSLPTMTQIANVLSSLIILLAWHIMGFDQSRFGSSSTEYPGDWGLGSSFVIKDRHPGLNWFSDFRRGGTHTYQTTFRWSPSEVSSAWW